MELGESRDRENNIPCQDFDLCREVYVHGFRGHNGDEGSGKRGFNLNRWRKGTPEGHK